MTSLSTNKSYLRYLNELKIRIRSAQLKAAHAVNSELIKLYWEIGRSIIERQKNAKWGSRFLENLSKDLKNEFPGMAGFSLTNLKRMRQLAQIFPEFLISPQLVGQLPWGHISVLMEQVKKVGERDWYAMQALEYGWSRNILSMQIESNLYERQGSLDKKVSNFRDKLPPPQSDMAEQALKDPYIFDFLTIGKDAHELETEKELTHHITKFLLELGTGFAFVGRQVSLTVSDEQFFVDMLFYHIRLRCLVVIELKARKFKPEDAGQLNFYLTAVDNQLRQPGDNPTIGILLCKSKNKMVAEYALKGISKPMGISEYKLTKMMPKELKMSLPTIEEIEAELSVESTKRVPKGKSVTKRRPGIR